MHYVHVFFYNPEDCCILYVVFCYKLCRYLYNSMHCLHGVLLYFSGGDMPPQHNALDVYYKQVHRMIHERRQRENPEKK